MSLEPIAMGAIEPEATLADCEQALQQVERNAAIEQGIILRHVRDNRLYREAGFSAFEDWCEKRYGHTRQWAHQRIDLAQTAAELSTIVNTPQITSKDHARAIKPVIRDHGAEVAAEILTDAADGGKLTARAIDAAIQRHPATRPAEPESVYTVPADDYLGALNRYPELDVDGAEAGDIVRIAAMIDARPEHERDMRADAGSKWLRAKTEGRLDETPIDNDTEAADARSLCVASIRATGRMRPGRRGVNVWPAGCAGGRCESFADRDRVPGVVGGADGGPSLHRGAGACGCARLRLRR